MRLQRYEVMNKIQIRLSKILSTFFILFLFLSQSSYSQGVTNELSKADSLFDQRKYTESLEIYDRIHDAEGKASPAMLLRMAYIYEGLGNLSRALISLDEYYKVTSDKKVLTKMKELADQNGLQGYRTNDWDYILNFYDKYRYLFILVTMALAVLILAMMYRKKRKHQEFSPGLGIGLIATLGLFFYLVNFTGIDNQGIITGSSSYLMSGPSAGANLIEVVSDGHKVEIINQTDIWVQIKWKGGRAYIRENNIEELL